MSLPVAHSQAGGAFVFTPVIAFDDKESQFMALVQGSNEDYARAKALISENGQIRETFQANGSFDSFIVALLEDTLNQERYRQIYRIVAIMRGNDCITPLAEVALVIGYLHYKNPDVIGHMQQLLMQPNFLDFPRDIAREFRAQGKETVAALVDNFSSQMDSVRRTGELIQLPKPATDDKKV
jgi:hypothetical protein